MPLNTLVRIRAMYCEQIAQTSRRNCEFDMALVF